jgi:hypothetical protein
MEYPDKDDEPYEYAKERLKEIQRLNISPELRNLADRIGRQFFGIGKEVESFYIEESYQYVLDALDVVCEVILKNKNKENKIPIIKELTYDSEKVFEKIEEIEVLLEKIVANTKTLEAKVVSEEIISQIGKPNP